METAAKRVPISAAYLIGLIERDEALFAFAKGRGSSIMTITWAKPEMYEAVAPEFFVTSFPRTASEGTSHEQQRSGKYSRGASSLIKGGEN
jgi:hypothetical protein